MATDGGTLDTFPQLLMHHAPRRGARPEQGFRRGEHLALVGDNRPRLYATVCAAQCLGGVPVPLYQDAVATEMAFPIQNAEIAFAFAEDQEQVDKLLEILSQCPSLKRIYYDDPRGMRHYTQPQLMSYDKLLEMGRASLAGGSAFLEKEIEKGRGSDTAALFFTSGTTGVPKGVVLTHENLIDRSRAVAEMESLGDHDVVLAFMPPAWIGQNIFSYAQPLVAGYCICCPEAAETVVTDMREVAPTYYFAPPRVFEALLPQVSVRMEDASALKRWLS